MIGSNYGCVLIINTIQSFPQRMTMNFENFTGTRQYLEEPPPQVLLSRPRFCFSCTTQKITLFTRPGKRHRAVTAVIRHDALPHFPVFDFFSATCAIQPANSVAADRVKLIRTAIDIVVLHVSAAICRGFNFNHDIFRATKWVVGHQSSCSPKGLAKPSQCFHCVILCVLFSQPDGHHTYPHDF